MEFKNKKIILASKSPRRQELLEGLNVDFDTRIIEGIEEDFPNDIPKKNIPIFLAEQKADNYLSSIENDEIIITADTIVLLNETVLNKPANFEEAKKMLQLLSGKQHSVITGVCLLSLTNRKTFSNETKVFFKNLTDKEIEFYINTYKPFDKAGGYGIQEWIGYIGIEKIEGSYFNVVGLPVQQLYVELNDFVSSEPSKTPFY